MGQEDVDGVGCYRLQMRRPNEKQPDEVFYSIATGLPAKTITSRTTPSGATKIISRVSDYKDFDGIKIATEIVQLIEAFDTTYMIHIDSVDINAPLDDSLFQVPDSINQLSK